MKIQLNRRNKEGVHPLSPFLYDDNGINIIILVLLISFLLQTELTQTT